MTKAQSHFYFNLHKHLWSEMLRGKVIEYHCEALLENVRFKVRPAGHKRVLLEQRKNVHAFAIGDIVADWDTFTIPHRGWVELSYNPYIAPYFFMKRTGERVDGAEMVYLTNEKTIWALDAVGR